jgi:HK97 family phage major capsid protein
VSSTSEQDLRNEIVGLEQAAAGRQFTPDEKAAWNEKNQELSQFEKRRQRVRELAGNPRAVIAGADDFQTSYSRGPRVDEQSPQHVRAGHDAGLRTIERNAGVLTAAAADRLDAVVRERDPLGLGGRYLDAVADPAYGSAFGKILAHPTDAHLRFDAREVEAVRRVAGVESERAMLEGTGPTGGYGVPFVLDPTIVISGTGVLNPIRQISNVETIVAHEWRGVTADQITAAFVAEGTEATDNSPTLVQPDILAMKAHAFIPVSIELFQDWTSLQQQISNLIFDAKNNLEALKFMNGVPGSNEPTGLLSIGTTGSLSTTQRVQSATVAAYAVADPWTLKQAIPPRFLNSTTFAAAPAIWDQTYRFVAQGSTTEPRQFADGDRGGDFLGRPKVEWSSMVTTTTTASRIMVAGDFSQYKIVDRIGMTVEVIPALFGATNRFPLGMRGIYAYWRVGAAVLVPNAFRYLEVK